ncbi:hypothetical protein Ab1vBOLIVR5_gp110c [Agrobacterium phage OLIVR5]|uniref:Uncharacterized protein n=1 Tax=Agrobacterium phage OLIVR5 TaxID=2723773 RepID=A0A858MT35_9CAUD|nr:hypothetical protein KNU99_gp110 [Agrobacterium phage OLIVR5]QIW87758.1 hypothetical protein Ab1vBOLIVR5_gp110c [Agrobacterium phage OLIVR5]QIW88020.1 hypothetical protein Ab1vBOLIVR6_gp113c [Agrobacterium phage OLIVR6]
MVELAVAEDFLVKQEKTVLLVKEEQMETVMAEGGQIGHPVMEVLQDFRSGKTCHTPMPEQELSTVLETDKTLRRIYFALEGILGIYLNLDPSVSIHLTTPHHPTLFQRLEIQEMTEKKVPGFYEMFKGFSYPIWIVECMDSGERRLVTSPQALGRDMFGNPMILVNLEIKKDEHGCKKDFTFFRNRVKLHLVSENISIQDALFICKTGEPISFSAILECTMFDWHEARSHMLMEYSVDRMTSNNSNHLKT